MEFFKRNRQELAPLLFIALIGIVYWIAWLGKYNTIVRDVTLGFAIAFFAAVTLFLMYGVYYLTKVQIEEWKEYGWKLFNIPFIQEESICGASILKIIAFIFIILLIALEYSLVSTFIKLPNISFDSYGDKVFWIIAPDGAFAFLLLVYTLVKEILFTPIFQIIQKEKKLRRLK